MHLSCALLNVSYIVGRRHPFPSSEERVRSERHGNRWHVSVAQPSQQRRDNWRKLRRVPYSVRGRWAEKDGCWTDQESWFSGVSAGNVPFVRTFNLRSGHSSYMNVLARKHLWHTTNGWVLYIFHRCGSIQRYVATPYCHVCSSSSDEAYLTDIVTLFTDPGACDCQPDPFNCQQGRLRQHLARKEIRRASMAHWWLYQSCSSTHPSNSWRALRNWNWSYDFSEDLLHQKCSSASYLSWVPCLYTLWSKMSSTSRIRNST